MVHRPENQKDKLFFPYTPNIQRQNRVRITAKTFPFEQGVTWEQGMSPDLTPVLCPQTSAPDLSSPRPLALPLGGPPCPSAWATDEVFFGEDFLLSGEQLSRWHPA